MKWSISVSEYLMIANAVSSAVNSALLNINKSEPQLVANLVWHIPQAINALTQLFSKGFSVKCGGVFVHSKPLVKCTNFPSATPTSVEIGDLLLLRTGISKGTVIDRRAILIQAKKTSRLPTKPGNDNQHHLYAMWPIFEYVRSTKALNGKKRHIRGLDIYNASKYLLIGKTPCCNPVVCQLFHQFPSFCPPHGVFVAQPYKPELGQYRCFLYEVIDFILGDAGKTYIKPPPRNTRNWDRVIEDLVKMTARLVSKFMGRTSSDNSRKSGQIFCFVKGEISVKSVLGQVGISPNDNLNLSNSPPELSETKSGNDDGEGAISIIEFFIDYDIDKD